MAEILIGHVLSGKYTRKGHPEYCYNFVACNCSSVASCVLSTKEEPEIIPITCCYRAFFNNPLVRLKLEVHEGKVIRVLGAAIRTNSILLVDLRSIVHSCALAGKKYGNLVLGDATKLCDALSRAKTTCAKFIPDKLPNPVTTNNLYPLLQQMNKGFSPEADAQDAVNCCLLFGFETAFLMLAHRMEDVSKGAVQNFVRACIRPKNLFPIVHPEMIGRMFEISCEEIAEAEAAAIIRRETDDVIALPRIHFDVLGISESILRSLLEKEIIGEGPQGIFRENDRSLMDVLSCCSEYKEHCAEYRCREQNGDYIIMHEIEPENGERWSCLPITLHRYVVREVHVFFDHDAKCLEWRGDRRELSDMDAMTTKEIYDIFFSKGPRKFDQLENVHIHAAGISERMIAESAKLAMKKWGAAEVNIWEYIDSALSDDLPENFEACCGLVDPQNDDNVVMCSGQAGPCPIALGKHNFARAFVDFFAINSWCLTCDMNLARVGKEPAATMAETKWNKHGKTLVQKQIETHEDAVPLLSVPLLHSYTLPNNFFKNKKGWWCGREPLTPFLLREHRRLFHHVAQ